MTEAEWFADTTRLAAKACFFADQRFNQRRARLFGCACCRRVWHLINAEAARRIVELAEAYVDGKITLEQLQAADDPAILANLEDRLYGEAEPRLSRRAYDAILAAEALAWRVFDVGAVAELTATHPSDDVFPPPKLRGRVWGIYPDEGEGAKVGKLLQDILGNPFRPVYFNPAWRVPIVTSLAQVAYEMRSLPSGELDSDRLAAVADALERAGCTGSDLLSHLRSPGPHVRGCWVLDKILGKE